MPAIEIGRVCVKIVGREAGCKCVIVDLVDKNFVLVTGPSSLTGVKRRRVNSKHIKLTEFKIDIDRGCEDKGVLKAIKSSKLKDVLSTSPQE